jgi:hypothetical protein
MRQDRPKEACGKCGAYAGIHQPWKSNAFCECACHEPLEEQHYCPHGVAVEVEGGACYQCYQEDALLE